MLTRALVTLFGMVLALPLCLADRVRLDVPDVKSLLLAAIDAPDGRASGVLKNADTHAISTHFGATSPVSVDVATLLRYAQPGCRRLAVRIWQEGVRLNAQQAPGTQTMQFDINYCRDGRPPASLIPEGP